MQNEVVSNFKKAHDWLIQAISNSDGTDLETLVFLLKLVKCRAEVAGVQTKHQAALSAQLPRSHKTWTEQEQLVVIEQMELHGVDDKSVPITAALVRVIAARSPQPASQLWLFTGQNARASECARD